MGKASSPSSDASPPVIHYDSAWLEYLDLCRRLPIMAPISRRVALLWVAGCGKRSQLRSRKLILVWEPDQRCTVALPFFIYDPLEHREIISRAFGTSARPPSASFQPLRKTRHPLAGFTTSTTPTPITRPLRYHSSVRLSPSLHCSSRVLYQ